MKGKKGLIDTTELLTFIYMTLKLAVLLVLVYKRLVAT